jgi:thymidylate synthase ThyX
MGYDCKVVLDSIGPAHIRLTTFELTIPRIVLAEFNTHRMFSRNSASSRAIPVEKMLKKVEEDPFIPLYWGKNQKGMQAEDELSTLEQQTAENCWIAGRDEAVKTVRRLLEIGVHKQITNRLLEPFLWHTIIVTATEWENFFNLRDHAMAQPEIRRGAQLLKECYAKSRPQQLGINHWHLPLVTNVDEATLIADGFTKDGVAHQSQLAQISAARCARVSYLTHDGKRDPQKDLELCADLTKNGHMSPLEHTARAEPHPEMIGNFRGWKQLRKLIKGEAVFGSAA